MRAWLGGMNGALPSAGHVTFAARTRAHARSPGSARALMGAGGRALRNLAVDADNQAAIAQLGGIEALLAVLARHPDAVAVQEQAVGALANLAAVDDNEAAIARLGGIEALLAVLARHPDAVAVQEQAVGALRNLTVNADNKAAIAQLGGIEALPRTLQSCCKQSVHSCTQCQR